MTLLSHLPYGESGNETKYSYAVQMSIFHLHVDQTNVCARLTIYRGLMLFTVSDSRCSHFLLREQEIKNTN